MTTTTTTRLRIPADEAEGAIREYCEGMVAVRAMHERAHGTQDEWRGLVYAGFEDLLLKHGRFYVPQELPRKYNRKAMKQCFHNAAALARGSRGQLTYVEGIAAGIIPVHHAWCVDAAGKVVDVTWDPMGTAYFGVPFPTDRVRRMQRSDNGSMFMVDPSLLRVAWPDQPFN